MAPVHDPTDVWSPFYDPRVIDCQKHGKVGPLGTSVKCGQCQDELLRAGDALAHQLMHREHPELLDRWWALRGGHDRCTVCSSGSA
jgi:hypothetical protein